MGGRDTEKQTERQVCVGCLGVWARREYNDKRSKHKTLESQNGQDVLQ